MVSMLTILGIKETNNIPLDSYILIIDSDQVISYQSINESKENFDNFIDT